MSLHSQGDQEWTYPEDESQSYYDTGSMAFQLLHLNSMRPTSGNKRHIEAVMLRFD